MHIFVTSSPWKQLLKAMFLIVQVKPYWFDDIKFPRLYIMLIIDYWWKFSPPHINTFLFLSFFIRKHYYECIWVGSEKFSVQPISSTLTFFTQYGLWPSLKWNSCAYTRMKWHRYHRALKFLNWWRPRHQVVTVTFSFPSSMGNILPRERPSK